MLLTAALAATGRPRKTLVPGPVSKGYVSQCRGCRARRLQSLDGSPPGRSGDSAVSRMAI